MKKWLILNIRFDNKGKVLCAKSPKFCKNCPYKNSCEEIKCYYDPYDDMRFCNRNDYRKR